MFGMGMPEIMIILLVALIVVGPKRLPDLAKSLGKGLGQFRKATDDLKSSLSENESFKDLQDIKSNFEDTVQTVKPSALLDVDLAPSTPSGKSKPAVESAEPDQEIVDVVPEPVPEKSQEHAASDDPQDKKDQAGQDEDPAVKKDA